MSEAAITGLGIVSPLGVGRGEHESAFEQGHSAVEPACEGSAIMVGRIHGLNAEELLPDPKQLVTMSENAELACCAGLLALADAGIEPRSPEMVEAGLYLAFWYERRTLEDYLSIARASIDRHTKAFDPGKMLRAGIKAQPPYTLLRSLASVGALSIQAGIKGPNTAFCSSSIAGGQAIGAGLDAIRMGEASIALAGASDRQSDVFGVAQHAFLKAELRQTGTPVGPGDAAVMLVLEEPAAAVEKARRILGYVAGYGECYLPRKEDVCLPSHEGMRSAIATCLADATAESRELRVETVLHAASIDSATLAGSLEAAGVEPGKVELESIGTPVGALLSVSVPWSIAVALSARTAGDTLVCAYGASGHHCATLVRRAT